MSLLRRFLGDVVVVLAFGGLLRHRSDLADGGVGVSDSRYGIVLVVIHTSG